MIEGLITLVSGLCFILGSFLIISGAVGVLRFPDFYTRMHAAGVTETLAAVLIIAGLMLHAGLGLVQFKLIMIILFILLTSPTASHALVKAAQHSGLQPQLVDDKLVDDKPAHR